MSSVEARARDEQPEWRLTRFVMLQAVTPPDHHTVVTSTAMPITDDDRAPVLDADGLLRVGRQWIAVPDSQIPVVTLLVERFQCTVSDADLLAAFSSRTGSTSWGALKGGLQRLRPRVDTCGLSLSRVRERGYILDHSDASTPGQGDAGSR
jgi:hypothetical protein